MCAKNGTPNENDITPTDNKKANMMNSQAHTHAH